MARQILAELSEALGQPVVVENRPAGTAIVGWNHVAAAAPDGYTLLLAENALAMSQALYTQGEPVVRSADASTTRLRSVASSPMVLVVANNVKASTRRRAGGALEGRGRRR